MHHLFENFLKFVIFLGRLISHIQPDYASHAQTNYSEADGNVPDLFKQIFFPKTLESIFALQYLLKEITFTFKACWEEEEISSEHYKAETFCPTGY